MFRDGTVLGRLVRTPRAVFGIVVLLVNFVTDLFYAVLDPRIRYDG